MKTTELIKERWAEVLKHYGVAFSPKRHINCPICGSEKSLRTDAKGAICKCDSYSHTDFLLKLTKKSFRELCNEIDALFNNTPTYERERKMTKEEYLRNALRERWGTYTQLKGTNAEEYLKNRGIFPLPKDLKCCKFNIKKNQIVCINQAENKTPLYVHLTHLVGTEKRKECAKTIHSLQSDSVRECATGSAIYLFDIQEVYFITEGLENALSVKQIYGMNGASVMNANMMKKFVAPHGVKKLVIFADNDVTGISSAFECARKNVFANNDVQEVSVRWYSKDDYDVNDYLRNPENVDCYERLFKAKKSL